MWYYFWKTTYVLLKKQTIELGLFGSGTNPAHLSSSFPFGGGGIVCSDNVEVSVVIDFSFVFTDSTNKMIFQLIYFIFIRRNSFELKQFSMVVCVPYKTT